MTPEAVVEELKRLLLTVRSRDKELLEELKHWKVVIDTSSSRKVEIQVVRETPSEFVPEPFVPPSPPPITEKRPKGWRGQTEDEP